jgi:hypothetical protein
VKKRTGFIALLVTGTLLLTGLVGSLVAEAAVDGTVAFDKSWYTTGAAGAGSTVKVTVTDADVNVTTAVATTETFLANATAETATLATGSGVEVVGTPVVLVAGQSCPDGTVDTNINVSVFNAAAGTVTFSKFTATSAGAQPVCYNTGAKNTLSVDVWSTQTGETGKVTLTATETTVDSGKFEATVSLINAATSTAGYLHALNLNTLSARYTDSTPKSGTSVKVSASASVETAKPAMSSLSPVDDHATQQTQPVFTGTITDSGAGIDVSTVVVTINSVANTPTVTGSDGDLQVTYTVTPSALSEGDIAWQVSATDMAGNIGLSDSDGDVAGDQTHTVRIDKTPPGFAGTAATTGKAWDSVTSATSTTDNTTGIEVFFDENLDAASVAAADFTVDSITPLTADVYSKKKTSVYLTVATAIAADATPTVAIATGGAVSDLAGNALNVGSEKATDGIAPTFTVTLDTTLSKAKVVVSVTADETISGVPVIKIHRKNAAQAKGGLAIDGATVEEKSLTVVVKTLTSWEAEFSAITGSDGVKAVVVTGNDLATPTNSGSKGNADPANTKAITFTQDTSAPVLTFDPLDAASVYSPDPFVKFNYDEKVTITKVEFGEKGETLTDVTASVFSSDDKQWIYSAKGLVTDEEYTAKVTASDLAGTELKDQSANFTVKARKAIEYALVPGNNLISLVGDPADTAINNAGLPTEVTSVISYQGGAWLVATRGADGTLSGSLTTMDASSAYWVDTTSPAPMKVSTPEQAFQAVLPSISVKQGWNMVPVVVLNVDSLPASISADTYFGSVDWITAYSYDTATTTWSKVLPKQVPADTVAPKKGYWLYAAQDGILVP